MSVLPGANSPHPLNADHLIGVRYNGGWEYNDNYVWVPFTPVTSDVLLASANFSTDTVTSLEGTSGNINSVAAGFRNWRYRVCGQRVGWRSESG